MRGSPETAHHVIAACPTFAAARQRDLVRPPSYFISLSIIFGTKEGGTALGAFLAETQAHQETCMKLFDLNKLI
jgi:hypothetical protein